LAAFVHENNIKTLNVDSSSEAKELEVAAFVRAAFERSQ
jgi:hypothetical protein